MKKYIDTSTLVTFQSGNNKGHFDWINNIGKELYFEYDDISGIIKILNYEIARPQGKITVQYKDNIITTSTSNIIQLKIPSLFNKEKSSRKYKYEIGDIINKNNQISEVLERIRISHKTGNGFVRGYKLECNNCNYQYETRESRLSSCPVCGIRTTYSERFIFSIFIQAKIDFVVQKEFSWLKNRWYDVYLPQYNAIIEIHGIQHFEPTKMKDRENKPVDVIFNECIESDKLKMDAAIKNGMKYYIIDARNQDNLFKEAKKVLQFIDFSKISEFECGKFAIYNTVKNFIILWNIGHTVEEISQITNKSIAVVQNKLRQANEYKLCLYDKTINMKNHKIINPNRK